ncbi:proteinase inhibitor [Polyangium sp. 15x6]|uniref:proteinase inhibitor n=1 Tax=Polyangium sp. 15x6 TaxID=3042687 RepID=UPI00249B6673|nr:proteinase inhibitor [Polyangium sp. 15x6]MDI3287491.1 proteinase inhibitor [Polyangium sp. 15x6]
MKQEHLRSPHVMLGAALLVSSLGGLGACQEAEEEAAPAPEPAAEAPGRCIYTSPFTQAEECRDYTGKGWSAESAEADCKALAQSTFTKAEACAYPKTLGRCVLDGGKDDEYSIVFPGEDTAQCASTQRGCELFGGGKFLPDACEGVIDEPGNPDPSGSVFQWPTEVCADPKAGEPAGQSSGKVCTFGAISGCTEPGRRFTDYASCEPVLTQRPYWPAPPSDFKTPDDDPRLSDAQWLGELAWVTEQVEACGCVCCHSEKAAPAEGPSNWYIEASPIWTDSFYPTGLALAAGWVSSDALGAYPPDQNNGFSRDVSGLPSTDPARMVAFFEGELLRRGFKKEDFASETPFGGPLYEQSLYVPSDCDAGQGVDAAGKITWTGGDARYVYILSADAKNPGAPPNLDLPEGTLWRLDVPWTAAPVKSGITYGEILPNTRQGHPADGSPEKLVPGTKYYLYVWADVGIPITRCLFDVPL